jgi:hypothetical protein
MKPPRPQIEIRPVDGQFEAWFEGELRHTFRVLANAELARAHWQGQIDAGKQPNFRKLIRIVNPELDELRATIETRHIRKEHCRAQKESGRPQKALGRHSGPDRGANCRQRGGKARQAGGVS